MRRKHIVFLGLISLVVVMIAIALLFTVPQATNHINKDVVEADIGDVYQYPANPAAELREFLENDLRERGLTLTLGDIEEVAWAGQERLEFVVYFEDSPDNFCVVSFIIKGSDHDLYRYSPDNPSFTLAFQDPDDAAAMITILTSVLAYLAPDLSLPEAERLAVKQDDTLTIDGYSAPLDLGGYQIQAHYTNPHVFFSTKGFDAKFAVTVISLQQIWGGQVGLSNARELTAPAEFTVLDHSSVSSANGTGEIVYSDFLLIDRWIYEDDLHGTLLTMLTVESKYGEQYSLYLDQLRAQYELGVGETYRLFLAPNAFHSAVVYAVQLSN